MYHCHVDRFKQKYPDEFRAEENKLNEQSVSLAFLANSDNQKDCHDIAELYDDFLKKFNLYPKDMSAMYKLLGEHSNHTRSIDST